MLRALLIGGDPKADDQSYDHGLSSATLRPKQPNEVIAEAFREHLKKDAGFKHVPPPVPMKNSKGAVVYYLFFAAQEKLAEKIAWDIFHRIAIGV